MIPAEIDWFVFLYLLLFLSLIFGAWVGYEAFRIRAGKRFRAKSARCPHCGMIYLPEPADEAFDLLQCPRCGAKCTRKNAGIKDRR